MHHRLSPLLLPTGRHFGCLPGGGGDPHWRPGADCIAGRLEKVKPRRPY